jgi:hypothetical protein
MNLFTETTEDYFTENVSDEIIMIKINFWYNIIIEELTNHLDISNNEKILYNTSNIIIPFLIQTIISRVGNNTREEKIIKLSFKLLHFYPDYLFSFHPFFY